MSRPWVLDSFDGADPVTFAVPPSSEAFLEEERLKSFDKGYRAGWDDSSAALSKEQSQISTELASNLQSLSFTYHEARNAVLGEMESLLKGLVATV